MLNTILNVPSTMVAERMKSCGVVLGAIETHGPQMVEILSGQFGPHLEEGQVMPFEMQLQLFEKELTRLRDRLHSAEREHRIQKVEESLTRGRRDKAITEVNAKVARVRRLLGGAYDDDQLAEVGFARRNARQPEELLEQAAHVAARLGDPGLMLAESELGDIKLDASSVARELEPSAERLRQALSDLRREEQRTGSTQLAKDEAMEEFNHGFLWMARTVESYLQLAGLKALAARVRPSSRRPGVTEQPPEEPPEADGQEPEADGGESEDPASEDPVVAQVSESEAS